MNDTSHGSSRTKWFARISLIILWIIAWVIASMVARASLDELRREMVLSIHYGASAQGAVQNYAIINAIIMSLLTLALFAVIGIIIKRTRGARVGGSNDKSPIHLSRSADWPPLLLLFFGLPIAFTFGGIWVGAAVLIVGTVILGWGRRHMGPLPTTKTAPPAALGPQMLAATPPMHFTHESGSIDAEIKKQADMVALDKERGLKEELEKAIKLIREEYKHHISDLNISHDLVSSELRADIERLRSRLDKEKAEKVRAIRQIDRVRRARRRRHIVVRNIRAGFINYVWKPAEALVVGIVYAARAVDSRLADGVAIIAESRSDQLLLRLLVYLLSFVVVICAGIIVPRSIIYAVAAYLVIAASTSVIWNKREPHD